MSYSRDVATSGLIPTGAERRRILRPDHQVKERGGFAVTQDDLLERFRPQVIAIATGLGNVSRPPRDGHPRCIDYRWKR
jgi:hypothetical protein